MMSNKKIRREEDHLLNCFNIILFTKLRTVRERPYVVKFGFRE
jgi:hypothetical protein